MRKLRNRFCMVSTAALLALGTGVIGCGSGDDPPLDTTTLTNLDGEVLSSVTTGYTVPSEISAVPADNTDVSARVRQLKGMSAHLRALSRAVGDLPATSDYALATGVKYIEEPALEQFDIIEQVLNAISQTKYASPDNINQGPYTAIIAWEEENEGIDKKTLEPWVVDSRMIVENGQDVNRVLCWIEEPDEMTPGAVKTIKAEFKVYDAATVDTDGTVLDYGVWNLNVKFDDNAANFFTASASVESGMSVIKINEYENWGPNEVHTLQGILYRSGTQGYGKMLFTDWESVDWSLCDENGCPPPGDSTVSYAYNAAYLGMQKTLEDGTPLGALFKDRDQANHTDMVHRYGLFYSENNTLPAGVTAGDNVMKHHSFGFPVIFADANGLNVHAYYGAWQGRHQLWGGENLSEGDTVTKEAFGPNQAPETYTVGAVLNGTLTKRTLVDATLSDIQDVPVETWINNDFMIVYSTVGGGWMSCDGWVQPPYESSPGVWEAAQCNLFDGTPSTFQPFANFDSLVGDQNGSKMVFINGCDQFGTCKDYVYSATNPDSSVSDPGFYEATWGMMGLEAVSPAAKLTEVDGAGLWVSISGSIYVAYTGDFSGTPSTTGWVEKELLDFNTMTWQPSFGTNDKEFSPEPGREYYINANGVNYIVKRKDNITVTAINADSQYGVKIELQTAANPVNYTSILPAGTIYLRTPWRPEVTYAFNETAGTDSQGNDKYLKLVVRSDSNAELTLGDVVTSGEWGLFAYSDAGTPSDASDDYPLSATGTQVTVDEWGWVDPASLVQPVQFNWEYSADGGWGVQVYLKDSNSNFVILDDPIGLQSVTATNGAGDSKTLMLQYDGWMHGMPDLYHDLAQNNWVMDAAIADKIINLPAGLEVSDGTYNYYAKPLETSIFLGVVDQTTAEASGLNISLGAALDLSTVPTYVDGDLGDKPADTEIKYVEGIPVSELN